MPRERARRITRMVASVPRCCRSGTSRPGSGCKFLRPVPTPCRECMPNIVPVVRRFSTVTSSLRMTVSRHQRAEGQVVIDIFVAVEVAELAAAGLLQQNQPGIVGAGSVFAGYAEWNAPERNAETASADFGVRRSKVASSFCRSGYIKGLCRTQAREGFLAKRAH